jgi:hypothetical protein
MKPLRGLGWRLCCTVEQAGCNPRFIPNFQAETGNYGVMTAGDFYALMEAARLPPVAGWNPPFCGDSRMRIARDGQWFHDGARIARPELVRLFAGLLRREGEAYFLVTPSEKLSIAVEDTPFLAVAVDRQDSVLVFTTNAGDRVTLDGDHALRLDGPAPCLHVRDGLEARVARNAWYHLADMAVRRDGVLGVESAGLFFALGPA